MLPSEPAAEPKVSSEPTVDVEVDETECLDPHEQTITSNIESMKVQRYVNILAIKC